MLPKAVGELQVGPDLLVAALAAVPCPLQVAAMAGSDFLVAALAAVPCPLQVATMAVVVDRN
jgi:hypothetical protein